MCLYMIVHICTRLQKKVYARICECLGLCQVLQALACRVMILKFVGLGMVRYRNFFLKTMYRTNYDWYSKLTTTTDH